MSNPFVFLNAINGTKEDLIRDASDPEQAEKEYKPFFINRSLSYHPDSIFESNDMNAASHIDGIMQNDFYLNILPKRKRFAKWSKTTKEEDVEAVMEYLECGQTKALEALSILSKNDVAMIYERINKGGVTNGKRSRESSGDSS